MNFKKASRREDPEINLIPFIDVLLVVLIFLMVSTTYSKDTALKIELPTAQAQKPPAEPVELRVSVDAKGQYALNNRALGALTPEALASELRAEAAKGGKAEGGPLVVINADASAAHQWVVNVLEASRMAGLERVSFLARKSGKGS